MRWEGWLWVLLAPFIFWYSPLVLGSFLGGLYACFAVPVYSQICQDQPLAFLKQPIAAPDYQMFLLNQGCRPPQVPPQDYSPREIEDILEESLKSIDKHYLGRDRGSEDLISRFLSERMDVFGKSFLDAAVVASVVICPLLNENVLLRGAYLLVYTGIVTFLLYLLNNVANDIYRTLKQRLVG